VVKKGEWKRRIHCLNPQGNSRQLHSKWVYVDTIDAYLHNIAFEARSEPLLEAFVIRRTWEKVLGQAP